MTRTSILRHFVFMAFGLALCLGAQAQGSKAVFTLAVVPQFPAVEIHRDWTPLLERLSKETGLTFKLVIASGIPEFEESLLKGDPDFAYMNPYHAVMAMRAKGYIALVRGSKLLSGILVVRKDDPIKSVQELAGKEIAFPAPNAFGASLLMRALLAEREKINITAVYVKTHSNAFRYVAMGKAAAAGGVNNTLAQEPEEIRANLRVLMETPGFPAHPLSAHPRVPDAVRKAVAEAMTRIAKDASGQALLANIQMEGLVGADYVRDYQPLEKFGLDKYVVRGSKP